MRRSWGLLIVVSLALSLAVPLLYGGLDSLAQLRRLPLWALALLLGMVFLGWNFNAARMHLLAHYLGSPMSRRQALATVVSAEFAWAASPAGAGGLATYVFLLTRHGLTPGRGAALVAVDQFTDLVFFATAMPLALVLYALHSGISHPLRLFALVAVLVLGGALTLAWLVRRYRSLALGLGRLLRRVPRLSRVRYRLARWLVQFKQGVRLLLAMGKGRMFLLYLFCVGHWMMRYGVLPMLLWLLGESVPWGYLFAIQALLGFVAHVTFLPGGGGGVEVAFGALLSPYLDPAASAFVLLVWRFCTFYWYLLAGAPVFVLNTGKMAGHLVAMGTHQGDKH